MGRNKIENDFKNKLDQRQIAPTPQSWDRLNAMLTVADENKQTRSNGWLHIAAGVLGFLFIGTVFLMQTEEAIDVKRNEIKLENSSVKSSNIPTVEKSNNAVAHQTDLATAKLKDTPDNFNRKIPNENDSEIAKNQNHIAENTSVNHTNNASLTSNKNKIDTSTFNQKSEQQITAEKVDELLAAAKSAEVIQKSSIKVNANSLLMQVDGELERSFREKVIKNFQTAKVTLANRNFKE